MEGELIGRKLQNKEIVYIKDDYEGKAIRLIPDELGLVVYVKPKGEQEYLIPDSRAKLVFEIEMGGDEITKQEYEKY